MVLAAQHPIDRVQQQQQQQQQPSHGSTSRPRNNGCCCPLSILLLLLLGWMVGRVVGSRYCSQCVSVTSASCVQQAWGVGRAVPPRAARAAACRLDTFWNYLMLKNVLSKRTVSRPRWAAGHQPGQGEKMICKGSAFEAISGRGSHHVVTSHRFPLLCSCFVFYRRLFVNVIQSYSVTQRPRPVFY